ncbi:MAG: hypothetical protein ACLFU0_11270 [Alphaproteobacteria bacterium]
MRVLDGLRVARERVLRAMAEAGFLSAHRTRPEPRPIDEHGRPIVTDAPELMWPIDGTPITTVRAGKVRLLATVERWNAAAQRWRVRKRSARREAMQALAMGVRALVDRYTAERLVAKNGYLSPHT